ncbi:MAG TPA: hypothetical protein VGE02_14970 [Gemmatimonadales bacterium]
MITSKSTTTTKRRAAPQRGGGVTAERGRRTGTGVPARALADGVVERRRTPRTRTESTQPVLPERGETMPALLSPSEHYRLEMQRRGGRVTGDLPTLLAEAKAEYDAQMAMPRPPGKGGRPRKKKPVADDDFDLPEEDALGED